MKKRLSLLIISTAIVFSLFLIGFFYGETYIQRILFATSILILSFLAIYLFFGFGKLVVSLIYGMILALLLVFLPNYDLALIFIGTFVFALNPLDDFEQFINKNLPEEKSIIDYLKGSYISYYNYRKEIKEHYHLPQVRKTINKPWYLKLRQAMTIILSMLAVFLLIIEVNNLISFIKSFDIHLFFASIYSVVVLISSTIMLYRKGFKSTLNLLSVLVFPAITYSLFLIKPLYIGLILGFIGVFLTIAMAIFQYFQYRFRIVFETFHYYDPEKQAEVYANALFENYIYDENFIHSTIFTFSIDYYDFIKKFHNIVVYADLRRFFITAYTIKNNQISLYTEFHKNDYLKIDKFKSFLNNLYEKDITIKITEDENKTLYEEVFFHNDNYIVSRAIYLSNMLKKLNIKSSVIISFMAYFTNLENIISLSKKYNTSRVPELDLEGVLTTKIDLRVNNIDYLIENKIRELLLDLLIYQGKYIRLNVYY